MPYVRVGKCVYKQNADGSRGDLKGCSDSEAEAKKYLTALYVHEKEMGQPSATASPYNLSGPGSLTGILGAGKKKKVKTMSIIDKMFPGLRKKEYDYEQALTKLKEYGFDYAVIESWDLAQAADALRDIAMLIGAEANQAESDDVKGLVATARTILEFLGGELDEIEESVGSMSETKESRGEKTPSGGHGGYLVTDPDGGKHLPTSRNGKPDRALAGAAWAALHSGYRGKKYEGPNKSEAVAKLKKLYKHMGWDLPTETKEADFAITKDKDGRWIWILRSSSIFQDRDDEIASKEAQEADVADMNQRNDFGNARWWHTGTPTEDNPSPEYVLDIGTCEFSAMDDGIRFEVGHFFDERIGDALAPRAKELSASLAFSYPENEPDEEGIFRHIHTIERSILPKERASNLLAGFYATKERVMDDDKIVKFKEIIGDPELVDGLLKKSKQDQRAAHGRIKSAERKETEAENESEDESAMRFHAHLKHPGGKAVKMDEARFAHAHRVRGRKEAETEAEGAKKIPMMEHDHTDAHMKEAEAAHKETEAAVKRLKEAEAEAESESESESEAEGGKKEAARRKEFRSLDAKVDALIDLMKMNLQESADAQTATKEAREKQEKRIAELEARIKELQGDIPELVSQRLGANDRADIETFLTGIKEENTKEQAPKFMRDLFPSLYNTGTSQSS